MAEPDLPVVRKNLSEGLYIMLDENLGGGVSLQKNIDELPEAIAARHPRGAQGVRTRRAPDARPGGAERRERPASAQASSRRSTGRSSRGAVYARQPEGMIDVGNDREFGFLSRPAANELEAAFLPLLRSDLPAESRRQCIQLAAFFRLPDETNDAAIRDALKDRLHDPDEAVRIVARKVLGDPGPIRPRPDYAAEPSVARPRTPPGPAHRPSLTTFRDKVNPLFYRVGEDGHSCAECHGTHTVLRIAPADAARSGEDPLTINYNSALKVIDVNQPENSLILRKPLSPFGQGDPDSSSPTGFTHVGGPRWDRPDHPAYRAILDWIRQAPKDKAAPTTTPGTSQR